MEIDEKALDEAYERFMNERNSAVDPRPVKAALRAAILAYRKHAPISEEMVERGARAICIQSVGGENYSDKRGLALFVDGNWKRYADDARACLSASLGKD